MNKFYQLNSIAIIFAMNLFIATGLFANWNKSEDKSSIHSQKIYEQTLPENKSDSLPEGVTEAWLNSLRDENGNKVIYPEEDPEGDAMQRKIFNGFAASNDFGYSVSNAGDVNADGFDDIIVGARSYSSGLGRAYIFYGSLDINTVADVIMTGEAASDNFGNSVSGAGDVNGDGYADVIVGAPNNNSSTGKAYIYFGGLGMNNVPDVNVIGETVSSRLGISVSDAGDVNGDGYSDVIVGARGYNSSTGRGYIFFGGLGMNNVADVTFNGETTGSFFGWSVSGAGDVNGDGYSDVIAGAYAFNSNTGRAYVFFGGSSMNNAADVTMNGEAANNNFGYSVSGAGDVDGDGYSDVIIGAYGYNSNTGRTYIFFGGSSMNNGSDKILDGGASGNFFGASVSNAGDVNCDGYSDVICGAYTYNSNTGKAYIYVGGTSMSSFPNNTISGEATNNYFGISVSNAGDVNGDGYADVISGAYGHNTNTGRVYLYDYLMKNEIVSDLSMSGEATNNSFGISVSNAGDVNHDGKSDWIVGASGYSGSTGRAYIFFGGYPFLDNIADVILTGEASSNYFGSSVSSAGDVNGDNISDVIVGAKGFGSQRGKSYIFFGGNTMDNVTDVVMSGETTGDQFGSQVSDAGDVNRDGFSDVIVGAGYNNTLTGKAYIYFGGAVMDITADVIMTGQAAQNLFGASVAGAGDVNDDGYSDVIVGAPGYNTNTGRVYIFLGGNAMDNIADVAMTGETQNTSFGIIVSGTGDLNGDGYDDVVVGVSLLNKAFVYFGNILMNDIASIILTGESSDIRFGASVSEAGDVNRDGFSDIIIGAYNHSFGTGRAYIFFGSSLMNNVPDVKMTGQTSNENLGYSVSGGGDLNGDGYSDVIVGASAYNSNTGRSDLYFGSAIPVNPTLLSAKDVPYDQGGYLNLKFAKSTYDVPFSGEGGINYQIERSAPPNLNGYQWIFVGSISGTYNSFYTAEIHTPLDSGSLGNNSYFFRVTAVSNSTGSFWRSNIMSGHSVDNLSPPIVSPFTASASGSNVSLNWGNNPANDLLNYVLFRSTSSVIDPYTEIPLSTVTAITYLDTSPLSGSSYYFIVAQDIHGNYSPVAVVQRPLFTLNLTMLIQGFYDQNTNSMIGDSILVSLRNSSSPYAAVDYSSAYVNSSGQGTFLFSNASNGVNYYIQLKHRNLIETWSNTPQQFTSSALTYNFTSAVTQAFGDNMIQVDSSPIRFASYNGDVNQDGAIDLTDIVDTYNDANLFLSGYVATDVTGDNFVDLSDVTLTFNNSNLFVTVITP